MPVSDADIVPLDQATCVHCKQPVRDHSVAYVCSEYLEHEREAARVKERSDVLEFLDGEFEREERRAKDMLMHGSKEASSWAEERARAYCWAADAIRAKEHLT